MPTSPLIRLGAAILLGRPEVRHDVMPDHSVQIPEHWTWPFQAWLLEPGACKPASRQVGTSRHLRKLCLAVVDSPPLGDAFTPTCEQSLQCAGPLRNIYVIIRPQTKAMLYSGSLLALSKDWPVADSKFVSAAAEIGPIMLQRRRYNQAEYKGNCRHAGAGQVLLSERPDEVGGSLRLSAVKGLCKLEQQQGVPTL